MHGFKNIILALSVAAGLLGSGVALADRGHFHGSVGVYVGPGFGPGWGPGWGPYYPRPYYYDPFYYPYPLPPAVIVRPAPQPEMYVEQPQAQVAPAPAQAPAAPATDNYWYHCAQPEGYYPYVKECPQGWQKVAPQPPAPAK